MKLTSHTGFQQWSLVDCLYRDLNTVGVCKDGEGDVAAPERKQLHQSQAGQSFPSPSSCTYTETETYVDTIILFVQAYTAVYFEFHTILSMQ